MLHSLNSKTVIFRRAELHKYFVFYLVNFYNKIAKFEEAVFYLKLAAVMALFTSVLKGCVNQVFSAGGVR